MSIKAKLALLISVIVTVILTLNISLYYFTTKAELKSHAQKQMVTIAKQIGTTLEATEKSKRYMEDMIGEKLRIAAIAAKSELPASIELISNFQLAQLAARLGVDHISLWQKTDDDIVILRSSDPTQINQGSKTWHYWYTAFQQMFARHRVDIPQGQKLPNFWAGPINYSTTDTNRIDKWGYYYDGTTDYMINPYVDAKVFLEFADNIGTNTLIRKFLADNPDILGVTGFDPEFFGKPPITRLQNGILVQHLDALDIAFGEYKFQDRENDIKYVMKTSRTGQIMTTSDTQNGKQIIKSFIPLQGGLPYVVGVVFDEGVINMTLNSQLLVLSMISVVLVLFAWIASYFIAGVMIQPLRQILRNVNEIAEGRFGTRIPIHRGHDELGMLSYRVNTMADNLQTYTDKLKETAMELRGTKEYLESFVNQTLDAIHVTDLDGKVRQVNNSFEKMFGWCANEVLGKALPHPESEVLKEYDEIRDRILRGETVTDYETVRHAKDGHPIDLSITVSPIYNENGEMVAISEIARNITTRKQAEEVIRRSEKLSVIGQLAAGVAHEIRNPLTTLRGFVQLQQQKSSVPASHVDIMLSELDRINFIVSEFLVLAKPQAEQYQSADVQELLENILMLLDSQANLNNIQFVTRFPPGIPPIVCEPNQLKQVFVNILKNGIEAMVYGGTIWIEMENAPSEGSVLIRITDEGCGIPEDQLPHLGEPFFTNKLDGTGLGLMVSQRIIANHKGNIHISSKVGEGTAVELRLPISTQSDVGGQAS